MICACGELIPTKDSKCITCRKREEDIFNTWTSGTVSYSSGYITWKAVRDYVYTYNDGRLAER